MTSAPPNTVTFAVLLIALVLAVAVWLIVQRLRTLRLKRRLGPEYDLTITTFRSPASAEPEWITREKRVARLQLVPLTPADAFRFSQAWNTLQGRFIDSPKGVVTEADRLARELMSKRGYPMGDFDNMAADISIDHPSVVAAYRAAQSVATRDARGEADSEELRKAVIHFRALFDELLGVAPVKMTALAGARRVPVHP
jgi:hypothetical protein